MTDEYRIVMQPEAADSMEAAFQWIEADSPEHARKWAKGVMDAIESLRVFPRRYALAPENDTFPQEIRHLLHGKRGGIYRIIFTVQEDVVNVLHIRHGAQEPAAPPDTEE